MTDVVIGVDAFSATIEQILGRLESGVDSFTPDAVNKALEVGEREWKKNAQGVLSSSYTVGGWGKPGYGRTISTGKYARSIKHHMLKSGGKEVDGEIGSPSFPGLPHLLEKGHAQIGGGFVAGREHIAPAAEKAFDDFEQLIEEVIDDAIANA